MLIFWNVAHAGFGWAISACLVLAFISAVVPWVNAEILVLALPALAPTSGRLALLVGVVTAGQMVGKCLVYEAGRRGLRTPRGRTAELVARWQHRLGGSPLRCTSLVAFSSVVGLPPFYLMSIVAGILRLPFGWFLFAGTAGRLVRFGTLAFLPGVLVGAL